MVPCRVLEPVPEADVPDPVLLEHFEEQPHVACAALRERLHLSLPGCP